jgi:trehalose/maltose hydrolase-like predicted phosphorylase
LATVTEMTVTSGSSSGWTLRYEGFAPLEEGLREALCTVGNGYFATRGAAPEAHADGVHYPGTYIAGCYNQLRTEVTGQTVVAESLVNAPNWLVLTFAAEDGPWLDLGTVEVLQYQQELDLRRGVLTRRLRIRDAQGRITRASYRRFAHMGAAHLAGLKTTIVPENWSGRLRVRSELDGNVANTGVSRYRQLGSRHLVPVEVRNLGREAVLLVVETSQSHIRIAEAARTRAFCGGARLDGDMTVLSEPGRIGTEIAAEVTQGDEVTVEKIVAITTSRDHATSDVATAAADWLHDAGSFGELLEEHVLAWAHLWARFSVELHDSPVEWVLKVLRLHTFHLLQTASPNSIDRDVGVPARGLHGEAYRGHIFWDDMFVFPVLTLRLPELTRSLEGYRYRRLPAARRAARDAGHLGAMYPWQSASDGREQSQLVHLNPKSGRWLPDTTYLQRHVGIAVARCAWQYYQATGDRQFLALQGAEMIFEIARFFASLATYDRERDRYVIRGVVGPDEFHTSYPGAATAGIDNNAYTNVMTAWLLLRAAEIVDLLPEHRRTELTERLGLTATEIQRWAHVARRMFVPFHADGVISQFEGYESLAELDWDGYRSRYGNISRLDRILEAENDTPNRYKVAKQADVLMLFYLLSASELAGLFTHLGYEWDPRSMPETIDYYLARTTDGSTLSTLVHASVAGRAHQDRAVELCLEALRSDVADVQGGTTAEGIHLGAMSGSIDVLQRSFAGVELRGDVLRLDPFWPKRLGVLEFSIFYRDHAITLTIQERIARVSSGAGKAPPVRIVCRGEVRELHAGESLEFELSQQPGNV